MSDATDTVDSVRMDDSVQFLIAQVGDERVAVELGHLRRVVETSYDALETTPVPRTARAVEGVSRFQGDLAVIVDAQALLGEPDASTNRTLRIVLLTPPAGGELVGLLVDTVEGFETVPTSRLTVPEDSDRWNKAVLTPDEDDPTATVVDIQGLAATVGSDSAR